MASFVDRAPLRVTPGERVRVGERDGTWPAFVYVTAAGGEGWFLSFHVFARYVKVTFFRGTSLDPVPPGASKHPEVRYLDIHEGAFDEAQFLAWVRQAASLPGEKL